FVTGGGKGVGRRICLDLAAEGVAVAVNDIFEERANAVAAEIQAAGGRAFAAVADITNQEEVNAVVTAAATALGPIDILVNNAGVLVERREKGGAAPLFVDTEAEGLKRIVDL